MFFRFSQVLKSARLFVSNGVALRPEALCIVGEGRDGEWEDEMG